MTVATLETQDFALELHELLRELDPSRWCDDAARRASHQLEGLRESLERLQQQIGDVPFRPHLDALAIALEGVEAPDGSREAWMAIRATVWPAYEGLADALRDSEVHIPRLRPTNYARNLFHVTGATVTVLVAQHVAAAEWLPYITAAVTLSAVTMEVSRRLSGQINDFLMRVFAPVAHPHETTRVNSATWYAVAVLILSNTIELRLGLCAVVVLGFADPAAAITGRRWGRTQLVAGRTLEGSLAFVAVGAASVGLLLALYYPETGLVLGTMLAITMATTGALAEICLRRIDDNLTIPLAAAGAGLILLHLTGSSPV